MMPFQKTMSYPADWRVTSRCTLSCDFCYGPVPGIDPVNLRTRIFDALKDSSSDVITFCGGEPLLAPEIGFYAAELQAAGKHTILNTNGSLLKRRIADGMPLAFDIIGISLDGSTEYMHRKMRGGRADFSAVMGAATLVSETPGIKLKLATVVSSVNKDDLPALAKMVRDMRPAIWRLYQYSELGSYNRGQARHLISTAEFVRIAECVTEIASPVSTFASTAERQGPGCLIVSMDGAVFQATSRGEIFYGNCLQVPLDEIWHSIPTKDVISQNKKWHIALSS
jgi:MoaA/NifB/PqqE/SkfB family radical SAM enzyme